MKLKPY